ncbi:MAG: transposase [Lentisphaeria bacterium]|nr:MAG: transposase [Lentisphaeria bacterium]
MRKSFDGLAGAVEEYIQQEPESGHAFVFFRSQSQNGEDFAMAGRWLYDLDEALGKRCLSPSQIGGRAD